MICDLPQRKPVRLSGFDYSADGAYFVTVCTKNREMLFWNQSRYPQNVGAIIGRPDISGDVNLSPLGIIAEKAVCSINSSYPMVFVDNYVIMPNHVHILLRISSKNTVDGRPMVAPTVSVIMQQMKGIVSKTAGYPIWQRSFHNHIIRNSEDYRRIYEYIENNPLNWQQDCFYI